MEYAVQDFLNDFGDITENEQSSTKIQKHLTNNSARFEELEQKEEIENKKEELKQEKDLSKIEKAEEQEEEEEQKEEVLGQVNINDLLGIPVMSYGAVLNHFLDYPLERYEIYKQGIIDNAKLVLQKHGIDTAQMTPEVALSIYALLPLGEAGMLKVIKKIKPKNDNAKKLRDNLLKQLGMNGEEANDGTKE